ncbi:hypothetical protein LHYA1_G006760 [Lachnellula hyalina]|uniref:Uncharacterized protein n=1 Tax=Lachnellula hyalina TaxID=1316788 RepID=A0A8H8TXZ9_9HELO|nr:uncharacterized protein LHYA1_G006760 [Lachnellula hyalina]TVY24397.1 hypothetical protein LHYA1_G006760 [Lachnellula hyalina]
MRRSTRRALFQLALFFGALFLILFLNRSQASNRSFAWNKIRYRTASATLPEAQGICPGLTDISKPALVVARVAADGDTKWLHELSTLYHLCIYTADAPADATSLHLQVPANRGHEAMAYLTFLIDNYENIPTAGAVFVHGSRFAWHNDALDYDNAPLLAALNVSAALAPFGYHNLRCDWSLSTCPPSYKPQGSLEMSTQALLAPYDSRAVSDAALPRALADLFGGEVKLGRTNAVRSQCCAQFIVSRDRVWQHSREEYVALRQWLLDSNGAPRDDRVAGRILSYVWHILFIKAEPDAPGSSSGGIDLEKLNAHACPRADQCYCRLYGRCDLSCTSPGNCPGQYILPPKLKVESPQ